MIDEGIESEALRCSAIELRRDRLVRSSAGGTRTRNHQVMNHGLRFGTRSCIVWRRRSGQRHFRAGIEPADRSAVARLTGRRSWCGWTPSRQSPCAKTIQRGNGSDVVPLFEKDVVRIDSWMVERRRWESNPLQAALQAAASPSGSSVFRKCSRQESNLVLDLRRVACESTTLRERVRLETLGCRRTDCSYSLPSTVSSLSSVRSVELQAAAVETEIQAGIGVSCQLTQCLEFRHPQ